MKIELKGLKTMRGMEGMAFDADLYIDGKKSGSVMDDGWGGGLWFSDRKAQERLNEWAKLMKPDEDGYPQDAESVVCKLVDEMLWIKKCKRLCRTQTVFRKGDTPDGEWMVIRHPYDERMKAHLFQKYGRCLEIMNESLKFKVGGAK